VRESEQAFERSNEFETAPNDSKIREAVTEQAEIDRLAAADGWKPDEEEGRRSRPSRDPRQTGPGADITLILDQVRKIPQET
jgi:hypothetical protein